MAAAPASASEAILDKLQAIEDHQIGEFAAVKGAIAMLSKMIGELKESVALVNEAHSSVMASTIAAAASGRPVVDGEGAKRKLTKINTAINPQSMEITARPLKCSPSSNPTAYTINTQTVCSVLFALIYFDRDYPGSANAVVDLIMSSIIGFKHGVNPIQWDAPNKTHLHLIALNIKAPLERIVQSLLNNPDQTDSKFITDTQKTLIGFISEKTVGSRQPAYNLASLFQNSFQRDSALYQPSSSGSGAKTSNKVSFPNSFLGIAWHARLPTDTKLKLGFPSYDPSAPIPLFRLMDKSGKELPAPVPNPTMLPVPPMTVLPQGGDAVGDNEVELAADETSAL